MSRDERADDGIEREQCLVREKYKVEESNEQLRPKAGECLADTALLVAHERAAKAEAEHDESRKNEQEEQNNGPISGPPAGRANRQRTE